MTIDRLTDNTLTDYTAGQCNQLTVCTLCYTLCYTLTDGRTLQ